MGRFRYKRMPKGISPASEYFQYRLDQALEGLPGVWTIVDDIIIVGEGDTMTLAEQNHDKRLIEFLKRCREKGISLNKDKLQLKVKELRYIGHILTDSGLKN